jgi:hypothetical protein
MSRLLRSAKATIVSNAEIAITVVKDSHPMNHGAGLSISEVKYVNAIHSSSFPDGTNGESWICNRRRT